MTSTPRMPVNRSASSACMPRGTANAGWDQAVARTRQHLAKLGKKGDEAHARLALNELLGQLKASRTRVVGEDDQEFWALLSIFGGRLDDARLRQSGAWFQRKG